MHTHVRLRVCPHVHACSCVRIFTCAFLRVGAHVFVLKCARVRRTGRNTGFSSQSIDFVRMRACKLTRCAYE